MPGFRNSLEQPSTASCLVFGGQMQLCGHFQVAALTLHLTLILTRTAREALTCAKPNIHIPKKIEKTLSTIRRGLGNESMSTRLGQGQVSDKVLR